MPDDKDDIKDTERAMANASERAQSGYKKGNARGSGDWAQHDTQQLSESAMRQRRAAKAKRSKSRSGKR